MAEAMGYVLILSSAIPFAFNHRSGSILPELPNAGRFAADS